MENVTPFLFVYGSLRKDFHHLVHVYVSDYFVFVGYASIKGKLYNLESFPAAIKCSRENFIKGELYQLQNEENFYEAFKQLDEYEEVNPGANEIPLFIREVTDVQFFGDTIQAWIYWYNRSVSETKQVMSGDILNEKKPSKII